MAILVQMFTLRVKMQKLKAITYWTYHRILFPKKGVFLATFTEPLPKLATILPALLKFG